MGALKLELLEHREALVRVQDRPAAVPPGNVQRPRGLEAAPADSFWQEKSVEELAAEQGVPLVPDLDAMMGELADCWDSEEEFDAFVRGIMERRRASER